MGINMKLLYCPVCDDVVRFVSNEWRMCNCKRSGGQYTPDNETAVIGGIGKVFGIPNPFFAEAYMAGPEVIKSLREKYGQWSTEVWWGEYKGDWQLIHVKNPIGPVPSDWEKRISKLKKQGGVKGYEGRTEIENRLRDKYKGKALFRHMYSDLSRNLFVRWRRKTKDEIINELLAQLEDLKATTMKHMEEIKKVVHEGQGE